MSDNRRTAEAPDPNAATDSSPAQEYLLARLRARRQAALGTGVARKQLTDEIEARLERTRRLVQDDTE